MKDPFSSIPEGKNELNANVFDLTHTRNLSTKLGQLTPIFCKKFYPHTSLSFDVQHAFQFMPMVFPIQTRIKCRVSFYKMPVRALWKDYQNWMSTVNTPQHANYDPPYVAFGRTTPLAGSIWNESIFKLMFGTGSLADHFSIPTTFDGFKNRIVDSSIQGIGFNTMESPISVGQSFSAPLIDLNSYENYTNQFFAIKFDFSHDADVQGREVKFNRFLFNFEVPGYNVGSVSEAYAVKSYVVNGSNLITAVLPLSLNREDMDGSSGFFILDVRSTDVGNEFTFVPGQGEDLSILFSLDSLARVSENYGIRLTPIDHILYADVNGGEISMSTSPWYNFETNSGIKLSSYPWRMYDAIYNTFIRNIRNNPLVINGNVEYNKVTRIFDSGGADPGALFTLYNASTPDSQIPILKEYYSPKFVNWELDQFTSAVPTPIEGIAPLVGLTVRQVTTTTGVDVNGNSVQTTHLNQYLTDEDGNTFKVTLNHDDLGNITPVYEQVEMMEGTPVSTMYDAITEGISVFDFRDVNAYTRYLELNQRRGYRYKDIIEGRYDVSVRFDELLMPEFIGGYTRDVDVNPVTQTVQTSPSGTTYDGALGSKAGDCFTFGKSQSNIKTYLDETSIVMGLISFVPMPIYTQALPKWLMDRDVLDEWSPEFNALGFQPISNAEVAPIQYFVNEPENLNGTFGYQRPWYDLVSMYDTAHGDFRGPLRNFLMHRVFSGAPKLTRDFTVINPEHVNDVFNVSENTDKIFGQVKIDLKVKQGVAKHAVGRLE